MKSINFYTNNLLNIDESRGDSALSADSRNQTMTTAGKRARGRRLKQEVVDAEDVTSADMPKMIVKNGKKAPASQATDRGDLIDTDDVVNFEAKGYSEPTPEEMAEWENMDPNVMTKNSKAVANAIQSKQNFIIFGEAGWAKTQIIEKMAHRAGYAVITVYLDKAEAADLGGIPLPRPLEGDSKNAAQAVAVPEFCEIMLEHKNFKWVLFLDEINQAQPDVFNALMPIVLEHTICRYRFKEMIVAAAGNFQSENTGVNNISENDPLMSRFPRRIVWSSHTAEDWAQHFEWAHKKWDSIVGKTLIDEVAKLKDFWKSPRDITMGIYEWAQQNMGKKIFTDPEEMFNDMWGFHHAEAGDIRGIIWNKAPERGKKGQEEIRRFCQFLYDYVKNNGEAGIKEKQSRGKVKNMDAFIAKMTRECLEKGYITFRGDYKGKKILFSAEEVPFIFGEEVGVNAQVIESFIEDEQKNDPNWAPKYMTQKEAIAGAKQEKDAEVYVYVDMTGDGWDYYKLDGSLWANVKGFATSDSEETK